MMTKEELMLKELIKEILMIEQNAIASGGVSATGGIAFGLFDPERPKSKKKKKK